MKRAPFCSFSSIKLATTGIAALVVYFLRMPAFLLLHSSNAYTYFLSESAVMLTSAGVRSASEEEEEEEVDDSAPSPNDDDAPPPNERRGSSLAGEAAGQRQKRGTTKSTNDRNETDINMTWDATIRGRAE